MSPIARFFDRRSIPRAIVPSKSPELPTQKVTRSYEISKMNHLEEAGRGSSPIGCLSEELLRLILDTLHYSFDNKSDCGLQARMQVPIRASHVSRFWRFVALENPLWWSDIVITPPWRIEVVEACLQRSKQCLLALTVFAKQDDDESVSLYRYEDYQRLLDLLFPHFYRCRTLSIRGIFELAGIPITFFFERFLRVEMPHLEEVILGADAHAYDFPKGGLHPIFASAPRLRDLRLIGTGILSSFSHSDNLASLTSLHLSKSAMQMSFSTLQTVLAACPSLTTLAIYDDFLTAWPGLSASCNVPSLETLYILSNMNKVSELLLFLSAPKLKELVIAPVVVPDLSLLLSHSDQNSDPHRRFPALKFLILAPAHPEAFEAVESASICFPQIECLVLANLYLSPFSEVFTRKRDDHGIAFPNLLDLALTGIDESFARSILDVQVFRKQQHHPLRALYMDSASLQRLKRKVADATFAGGGGEDEAKDHAFLSDWMEGHFWEGRRRRLLYSDVTDLFVGR